MIYFFSAQLYAVQSAICCIYTGYGRTQITSLVLRAAFCVLACHNNEQWRSQVPNDARALHTFFFFFVSGGGGLTNAVSLELGVVLTHDFSIRAHSTSLHQY